MLDCANIYARCENLKMRLEVAATIIATIFVGLSLYTIGATPPAKGYELSIYDAYPIYLWFFLVSAVGCGIVILLHQAFAKQKSRWWIAGILTIIGVNTIILLLPEFRGYFLYGREDTLSHIGRIKDILSTGHVGTTNFYPMVHILGTTITQITGLPIEHITSILFVLFSAIYILNIYLFAKSIANHFGQVLFTVALASPLIYSFFHANIHPALLSLFMIPSLLYFYHKMEKAPHSSLSNAIAFFLVAFFIVFCHPITTIFIIVILLMFGLSRYLLSHRGFYQTISGLGLGKNFLEPILMIFIVFFMWYFSYSVIQSEFRSVYDRVVYHKGISLLTAIGGQLGNANLTLSQTLWLFANRYGAVFLLLFAAFISCFSVLHGFLQRKRKIEAIAFVYTIQFLAAFLIGLTMLTGYFAEYEYDPIRLIRLPLLMGTLIAGTVAHAFVNKHLQKHKGKKVRAGILLIIVSTYILIMVAISVGNIFGSPRVAIVNDQVTRMDVAGTKFLETFRSPEIEIAANIPGQIHRFEDYNLGVDTFPGPRAKVFRVPSHFGYDVTNQIGVALGFQWSYLVVTKLDMLAPLAFPENARQNAHQYTDEDISRLYSDPTISKLYDNGEFSLWIAHNAGNQSTLSLGK